MELLHLLLLLLILFVYYYSNDSKDDDNDNIIGDGDDDNDRDDVEEKKHHSHAFLSFCYDFFPFVRSFIRLVACLFVSSSQHVCSLLSLLSVSGSIVQSFKGFR